MDKLLKIKVVIKIVFLFSFNKSYKYLIITRVWICLQMKSVLQKFNIFVISLNVLLNYFKCFLWKQIFGFKFFG